MNGGPATVGFPVVEPSVGANVIRSVYAHAPFCVRRCGYCDFAVQVRRTGDPDAWARALAGELTALRAEGTFVLADRLATLYVGGGTPSLLGPTAMDRLGEVIGRERLQDDDLEWTSEANPESFTAEVATAWKKAGVNRVSLGVQSFHEPVLRWMGRMHGAKGAAQAVHGARSAGFENLSIDLIFSLPEGVQRDWSDDLGRALALEVPHISLYGLTVEAGTPLGRAVQEGRERPAPETRYREEYLEACERLTGAGYRHYEVSNFALPGRESVHNEVYWSGAPYLGLGNSAHSYLHPVRRWNLRDWGAYEGQARDARLPVQEHEVLDARAWGLERVWLGLRTARGLSLSGLPRRGHDVVDRWVTQSLAVTSDGRVRLTPEGWLLLDRLSVELDAVLEVAGVAAGAPPRPHSEIIG